MAHQCENPLNNPKCTRLVKTKDRKLRMSCAAKARGWGGINNPMYGKSHSNETGHLMSKNHWKCDGENHPLYGKTYEEYHGTKKATKIKKKIAKKHLGMNRSDSSIFKQKSTIIFKNYGISYDEYLNTLDDKNKYYKMVWDVTKRQPIQMLENSEKRGRSDIDIDAYHLDHKVSISHGFLNKISPEKIGHISNLRFIHWKENIIKQGENYYE